MKLCISLCSGLGGQHQAFSDAGWDVVSVDIESRFRPTIIADIRYLPFRPGLEPQVLLAAPPCNHFSVAAHHFPRHGIQKALELVGACFEAVVYLKPRFWAIENPRGYLRKIIGRPRHTIRMSDYGAKWMKPTDIWGNVPFKWLSQTAPWEKAPRGSRNSGLIGVRDPAERAKWPLGLSQAILEATEK